jgi:hypothetical protein
MSDEDAPTNVRGTKNLNTMHIRKIWRRLTTSRHARTLEAELALERAVIVRLDAAIALQDVQIDQQCAEISQQGIEIARLRAENRALLNSILGIAGVPPVSASLDDLAATQSQIATTPAAPAANHSRSRTNATPHVAAPTRRRSWPQIHRLLEFESAQKEKPAGDPLPPAFQ